MFKTHFEEIENPKSNTVVLTVKVTTEDVKGTTALELIKSRLIINKLTPENKSFLFLHGENDIDCILMWAAKYTKNQNDEFLEILKKFNLKMKKQTF